MASITDALTDVSVAFLLAGVLSCAPGTSTEPGPCPEPYSPLTLSGSLPGGGTSVTVEQTSSGEFVLHGSGEELLVAVETETTGYGLTHGAEYALDFFRSGERGTYLRLRDVPGQLVLEGGFVENAGRDTNISVGRDASGPRCAHDTGAIVEPRPVEVNSDSGVISVASREERTLSLGGRNVLLVVGDVYLLVQEGSCVDCPASFGQAVLLGAQ